MDACTNHGHDFNEYSIDFLDPLKERQRLRGDLRQVSGSLSLSIGTRWTPSRIEDTIRARARVSYKDQGRTGEPRRAGSNQILSATRPVNAEGLSLFYI